MLRNIRIHNYLSFCSNTFVRRGGLGFVPLRARGSCSEICAVFLWYVPVAFGQLTTPLVHSLLSEVLLQLLILGQSLHAKLRRRKQCRVTGLQLDPVCSESSGSYQRSIVSTDIKVTRWTHSLTRSLDRNSTITVQYDHS